jgi:predicted Ser/Thr protein kinase
VQGGKHRVSVEIRQWVIDSDRAHEKTTVINERELVVRAYKR